MLAGFMRTWIESGKIRYPISISALNVHPFFLYFFVAFIAVRFGIMWNSV